MKKWKTNYRKINLRRVIEIGWKNAFAKSDSFNRKTRFKRMKRITSTKSYKNRFDFMLSLCVYCDLYVYILWSLFVYCDLYVYTMISLCILCSVCVYCDLYVHTVISMCRFHNFQCWWPLLFEAIIGITRGHTNFVQSRNVDPSLA